MLQSGHNSDKLRIMEKQWNSPIDLQIDQDILSFFAKLSKYINQAQLLLAARAGTNCNYQM